MNYFIARIFYSSKILIVVLGLALFLEFTCDIPSQPDDNTSSEIVIYKNSFENPADTAGFQRTGAFDLYTEAAPDGGHQSLLVQGSCIVPHVYFTLKPLTENEQLVMECWGKNLAIGGVVSLYILNQPDKALHISVQDSSWKKYTAQDTLIAAARDTLAVEMFSGGFVPSAMLVDCLKIIGIQ